MDKNILERIDMIVGEAKVSQLKKDIKHEIEKGNSKSKVWNRIKRMYTNVNKSKFEKLWNGINTINDSTCTGDVAVNKAKGSIDVVGVPKKKKKKRSKLTGAFKITE